MDVHGVMLLHAVSLMQCQIAVNISNLESMLASHIREQKRLERALPHDKKRVTWESFVSRISATHFRRVFHMELPVFGKLCGLIDVRMGEDTFRREAFLLDTMSTGVLEGTMPPICGEVKVAISLCMLAGGSHLDLVPLFVVSTSHLYNAFNQFLSWVMLTLEFPLVGLLGERNFDALHSLANPFAEKRNGVFFGPFGSLDGLAIRIRSSRVNEVPDPGNYCCRKGFCALNVQAICDMRKRFLWCYPSKEGSTHDSAAFSGSRLHDLLLEMPDDLCERGLFIAGDSAYSMTPFLITPHDTAECLDDEHKAKDSFNFHLSSCRIYIECTFGELIMRWGIFWRTLLFSLKKDSRVITVCMLLQNFIIDHRDGPKEDLEFFANFSVSVDAVQEELTRVSGEMPRAVVSDNNEPPPAGRKPQEEAELCRVGNIVRHRLTVKLAANDLLRPPQHNMKCNNHGHTHMDSKFIY